MNRIYTVKSSLGGEYTVKNNLGGQNIYYKSRSAEGST